ncbi:hypothetical protein Dcar01_03595 [Deinococcus carri]|uniref:Uncharacterized protein n=1 Tax=Deinococcus carri TaxID=1211323 RepID=A0ABP9WBY2_9DEIO
MRLKGWKLTFELDLVGYQFPKSENEASDWLKIRLVLVHGGERWEKVDPALLTFEVQWLTEWLHQVAAQAEVFRTWRSGRLTSRIFFTEPNLSLEALSGSLGGEALTLRVYLAAEFLPPFVKELDAMKLDNDPAEAWLDFPADAADLQQAAAALTEALTLFPVRAGLPHRSSSQPQGD